MYNKFFEYLLLDNPSKIMSYTGFKIRKILNPIVRNIAVLTTKSKCRFCLVRSEKLPKNRQIIFAPTHGFKDDVACTLKAMNSHAYILFGSIPQFYNTFDGIASWINGVIMVDRSSKQSRKTAMMKMEHYMKFGGNLLIFPEGVWNKSQNLPVLKLFPGIYQIAKKSNALVVPISTLYDENKNICYAIVDKAIDISIYTEKIGLEKLRDAMATIRWELIEKYAPCDRNQLLKDKTPNEYWEDYINFLISQVDYYDYEIENKAEFIDKNITENKDAFSHLNYIKPCKENAFLFNKRING